MDIPATILALTFAHVKCASLEDKWLIKYKPGLAVSAYRYDDTPIDTNKAQKQGFQITTDMSRAAIKTLEYQYLRHQV